MLLVILYICNYALGSNHRSYPNRRISYTKIYLIIYVIMLALWLETKYFTNVKCKSLNVPSPMRFWQAAFAPSPMRERAKRTSISLRSIERFHPSILGHIKHCPKIEHFVPSPVWGRAKRTSISGQLIPLAPKSSCSSPIWMSFVLKPSIFWNEVAHLKHEGEGPLPKKIFVFLTLILRVSNSSSPYE